MPPDGLHYVPVQSRFFSEVAYDSDTGQLVVITKTGVKLISHGVSKDDYKQFLKATSLGRFHREVIARKYGVKRIF